MHTALEHMPYCGLPPTPVNLWSRWNLDPVLIAALLLAAALYALGVARTSRSSRPFSHGRQALFYCGWILTAAALTSPLCPLSVALFSARVGQHMILTLIAAPLVASGHPGIAYSALFSADAKRTRRDPPARSPMIAAAAFATMLWLWHSPYAYDETFASTTVYWTMHITLFGSALWLWTCLLDREASNFVKAIGASVISSVQMGFLGAVILFAHAPLYAPHALTTAAWGLTAMQDQQLGATIMWAPGCLIFLAASMYGLWFVLEGAEPQERPAPTALSISVAKLKSADGRIRG